VPSTKKRPKAAVSQVSFGHPVLNNNNRTAPDSLILRSKINESGAVLLLNFAAAEIPGGAEIT
jgi:hypothetical protein